MKMSRLTKKRIIAIAACGGLISLICIGVNIYFSWTLLPVKSSPHTLSVALNSGWFHDYIPIITLKHYVDGEHTVDYTLTIVNGVHIQDPQKYRLPELGEGRVDVYVKLELESESSKDVPGSFQMTYDNASDLYEKGLLIYFDGDGKSAVVIDRLSYYGKSIYLVSGEEKLCYTLGALSAEWTRITEAPPLNRFQRNQPQPFFVWDSKWKENEWVVRDVS